MERRDFIKYSCLVTGAGALGCFVLNNNKTNNTFDYDFSEVKETCHMPFDYMEIQSFGDVFPCCPYFLNPKGKAYGNIFEKDLMSIWTGKEYNELRNKLLKGDFSLCNREICCYEPAKYDKTFNPKKQMPLNILLNYDQECNYKCIICRDKIVQNSDKELERLNNEVIPRILPFISKVSTISFSGGDPLASRHSRKLIKEVYKKNPNINIQFYTQGYYLDENNMKELGINKIERVSISIHSATRKTYEKIMRMDAFDRIMKNLEFVSEWKRQGKTDNIQINFAVFSMNYKEMKAFVNLAEKYDAVAHFWTYKPYTSAELHKRYKEVAVFEPWHKDYPKLQKILNSPVFKSSHCHLSPDLTAVVKV